MGMAKVKAETQHPLLADLCLPRPAESDPKQSLGKVKERPKADDTVMH